MSTTDEMVLGVDIGGTFTDVLAFERDSGRIIGAVKLPSSADAPALAASEGVDRVISRQRRRASSVPTGISTRPSTNSMGRIRKVRIPR